MSSSEYELIRKQLDHGERLIWSGRPRQGARLSRKDIGGFLVVLVVVSVFSAAGVLAFRRGEIVGLIFMVAVVLFVSASVFSAIFIDSWRRGAMLYGLTNRRAIVIGGILRRRVQSVYLHSMKEIALKAHVSGSGTITCVSTMDEWYRKNKKGEIKQIPLFRSIVDVRHVHDLLLEAKNSSVMRRY